ncbi:hypothetical protein [Microbacterium sp. 2FI]|uniref:three-helix bundle dimerization domain-containing protein n=1 Tax=Microbacterium sp. 2FI TaxID=2502193 RepID=UPI0014856C07|nr:hypothetical protein [Microbacterium sp. 2FI]
MDQVAERLATRFPAIDAEAISTIVREAYAAFADAHVRDFIPVLVEREAKTRLQTAA